MSNPRQGTRRGLAHLAAAAAISTGFLQVAQGTTFDVSWIGDAAGSYSVAANWSGGVVPNQGNPDPDAFYNVTIDRVGGAVVTGDLSPQLLNLTIGAANSLRMIDNSTIVFTGTELDGPCTIDNAGSLSIISKSGMSTMTLQGSTTSFIGGGTVLMQASAIVGGGTLTSDNIIRGAGMIGNDGFAIVNDGLISGDFATQILDLNPSANGLINNNIMRGNVAGILMLNGAGGGSFVNNGTITASVGGVVRLDNAALVSGGTFNVTLGSSVLVMGNSTINGSTFMTAGSGFLGVASGHTGNFEGVTNLGNLRISNNATAIFAGTSTNTGSINLLAVAEDAALSVGAGNATLNGTGIVNMSTTGAGNAIITGTGVFNTGVTIRGQGNIGTDTLTVNNTGSMVADIAGQRLTLDPGAGGMTNTGTLRASGGELLLSGNGMGAFDNTGGTIEAVDGLVLIQDTTVTGGSINSTAPGQVSVVNSTISGSTLDTPAALLGGGFLGVLPGNTGSFSGVTNLGDLTISNNATAIFSGTVTNNGNIDLLAGADNATMLASGVSLVGNGVVNLTSSGAGLAVISGSGSLSNAITIRGQGNIGLDTISRIDNSGSIVADIDGGLLTLDPGSGGLFNIGLLQAAGGELLLSGNGVGSFNNVGGQIAVSSGLLRIEGTTVTGGTIANPGLGELKVLNSTVAESVMSASGVGPVIVENSTLTDAALGHSGSDQVTILNSLLSGTSLSVSGNGLTLIEDTTVTGGSHDYSGNGLVTFTGSTVSNVDVNAGGPVLVTLEDTSFSSGSINTSTEVRVLGSTVSGSTLGTSSLGVFRIPAGSTGSFSNITNTGTVRIEGTSIFSASSTNSGEIGIHPDASNATLSFGSGTTAISGTGMITLHAPLPDGSGIAFISGTGTFVNGNTINGTGFITGGVIRNEGIIHANQSGAAIALQPTNIGTGGFNTGTMRATNNAQLILANGSWSNSGTVEAAGGQVQFFDTAAVDGGIVTVGAAGAMSVRPAQTAHIVNTTMSIDATGSFEIADGATLNLSGSIANSGAFNIAAGASDTRLNVASGSVLLSGSGPLLLSTTGAGAPSIGGSGSLTSTSTIQGRGNLGSGQIGIVNNGTIRATQALTIEPGAGANALDGTGMLIAATGGNLTLQGSASNTLRNSGQIIVQGGGVLNNVSDFTGGPVQLDGTLNQNDTADLGEVAGIGSFMNSAGAATAVTHARIASLSVPATSTFTVRPDGTSAATSRLSQLDLSGQIDLTNNDLILDYTTTSPLNDVKAAITTGYASGAWDGQGITSSAAAANPGFALGYAEASAVFGSFPAMFSGQSVDDTTVLVAYTRYGDATLDGLVNLDDFNRLAANFGGADKVWSEGDFDFNGLVNLDDFNRLAANFGLSAGPDGPGPDDWATLASMVPEPGVSGGLAIATLSLLRRRRRS